MESNGSRFEVSLRSFGYLDSDLGADRHILFEDGFLVVVGSSDWFSFTGPVRQ